MGDTPSGMDMNHLHLNGDAAERVGKLFDQLSKELNDILEGFNRYSANMGMGNCNEGNDWNKKVTDTGNAVFASMTGFVREVDDFAAKAKAAQTEFKDMDDRNKQAQIKLMPTGYLDISNNNVFPPFKDK